MPTMTEIANQPRAEHVVEAPGGRKIAVAEFGSADGPVVSGSEDVAVVGWSGGGQFAVEGAARPGARARSLKIGRAHV